MSHARADPDQLLVLGWSPVLALSAIESLRSGQPYLAKIRDLAAAHELQRRARRERVQGGRDEPSGDVGDREFEQWLERMNVLRGGTKLVQVTAQHKLLNAAPMSAP